jgi:hypothetical protein
LFELRLQGQINDSNETLIKLILDLENKLDLIGRQGEDRVFELAGKIGSIGSKVQEFEL